MCCQIYTLCALLLSRYVHKKQQYIMCIKDYINKLAETRVRNTDSSYQRLG